MYLKSTPPWMFSLYKTSLSKGKNKDFARQNEFFAMPMPMPTSMPMLMLGYDAEISKWPYFYHKCAIEY